MPAEVKTFLILYRPLKPTSTGDFIEFSGSETESDQDC